MCYLAVIFIFLVVTGGYCSLLVVTGRYHSLPLLVHERKRTNTADYDIFIGKQDTKNLHSKEVHIWKEITYLKIIFLMVCFRFKEMRCRTRVLL